MADAAYIVYRLPRYPVPFPKTIICDYEDPEKLKSAFNLTEEEFDRALDGEVIRGEFVIELNPEIYTMISNEHAKKKVIMTDEALKEREVAEKLGVSVGNVKRIVHDTREKIRQNKELFALLCDVVSRQHEASISGWDRGHKVIKRQNIE